MGLSRQRLSSRFAHNDIHKKDESPSRCGPKHFIVSACSRNQDPNIVFVRQCSRLRFTEEYPLGRCWLFAKIE